MKTLTETAPRIFSTLIPSFGYTLLGDRLTPIFKRENGIFVSTDYRWVGEFSNGLAPVFTKGMQYGYIAVSGELLISAVYSEASPFSCDRAFVRVVNDQDCDGAFCPSDSVTCLIDRSGNILNSFDGEMCYSKFVSGFCTVALIDRSIEAQSSLLYGLIDIDGTWVCEPDRNYLHTDGRGTCDTEGFLLANFGVPICGGGKKSLRDRSHYSFRHTKISWVENGFTRYTLGEKQVLKNEAGDYMMWIDHHDYADEWDAE